jgi:hypothetical protein
MPLAGSSGKLSTIGFQDKRSFVIKLRLPAMMSGRACPSERTLNPKGGGYASDYFVHPDLLDVHFERLIVQKGLAEPKSST